MVNGTADFTVGSRFIGDGVSFQSTAMRRFGIKILSFTLKLFAKVNISDCTSGYRAASREVLKILADDYPIDYPEPESLVHIAKAGYRIEEVPVNMFDRQGGSSSIASWKSVYYMIKVTPCNYYCKLSKEIDHNVAYSENRAYNAIAYFYCLCFQ